MVVKVIYEDSEVQVIHRQGDAGSTLLAFSAILHRPNEAGYWASSPADAYNINCISFSPKGKNYFPRKSIMSAKSAIDACIVGKVIGYGSSMGGYAALKYSALFKSDVTIAFSPQASVSPVDAPFDVERHCYYSDDKNFGMLVKNGDFHGKIFVLYDPKHFIDSKHVELLITSNGAHSFQPIPVAYAGHDLINLVASSSLFGELYTICLSGGSSSIGALIKKATRSSDIYRLNLGRYCIRRGKRKTAARLFNFTCSDSITNFSVASVQAIEYLNSGYLSDAKRYADLFLSEIGRCDDYGAANTVGWVYKEMNEYSNAFICYKRAVEIEPNVITNHYGLIDMLSAMGFFKQAINAARTALELFEHPELYGKLGWAALAGGDNNLAVESFNRALFLDSSLSHLTEGLAVCSRT